MKPKCTFRKVPCIKETGVAVEKPYSRIKKSMAVGLEKPTKDIETVRDGHGGGWSRKINAWHLYTLMVYL